MNIRERAIHLVLIWMEAGGREGGRRQPKSEASVQKRDRGFYSPLGGSGEREKKKNEKDR